jgi:hypothetical protein
MLCHSPVNFLRPAYDLVEGQSMISDFHCSVIYTAVSSGMLRSVDWQLVVLTTNLHYVTFQKKEDLSLIKETLEIDGGQWSGL